MCFGWVFFGGSCCILGGALLLTGRFPGAQKCFLSFLFYLASSAFHHDHVGTELAGTFVIFSLFLLLFFFFLSACLSGTIGNFVWRSPAFGSAGLVCPSASACPLAAHASRHTDSAAPGLVLSGSCSRTGQATGSCLPGHCRELVWESTVALTFPQASCSSPELRIPPRLRA